MKKNCVLIIGLGKTYGGVERFIHDVYKNHIEEYQLDFLIYSKISEENQNLINNLGGKKYTVSKYTRHPLKFLHEIRAFYKSHLEYKIIHCHISHGAAFLYTLPIWKGKERTIIVHSHSSNGKNKWLNWIMRFFIKKNSQIKIACSDYAGKWLFGKCNNIEIIPNGINTKRFIYNDETRKRVRKELAIHMDTHLIGNIGAFTKGKNQIQLVEIYNTYIHKYQNRNVKLLLIGEGNEKKFIESRIEKLGLRDKIILLPFQNDIEDYYMAMDLFLFTSKYEGFPLVLLEAQVSGLPTIASDSITKSVNITNEISYLSLKDSNDVWCKEIQKRCVIQLEEMRSVESDLLEKMDITEIGKRIFNMYNRVLKENEDGQCIDGSI